MQFDTALADPVATASERQVAALIWRHTAAGDAEILLVTSRVSGHWLLPKGWPIEGKSLAEAAMQEAFEEAGVWGGSQNHSVGSYDYAKVLTAGAAIQCRVEVFAVEALGLLADWPERAQRCREWVTLAEAAARVMEPDLARFLADCDAQFASQHFRSLPHAVAATSMPDVRFRETAMISAAQCRAARALIDWSPSRLAAASGLTVDQLAAFEHAGTLDAASILQVARALEAGGASFLAERRGRGAGVRLKFGSQVTKRIDNWENEGGPTAEDDIL